MSNHGTVGEQGPFGASTELDLLSHVICAFEDAERGPTIFKGDGLNSEKCVDVWVMRQAIGALKNYEALLRQPLFELIPPGFYHTSRPEKAVQGVR